MPIETLFRGACACGCGRYVPRPGVSRHVHATDDPSAVFTASSPTAILAEAHRRGWDVEGELYCDRRKEGA